MKNQKVTYWREKRTGCIYKYFGGSKPLNHLTAWEEVTENDWFRALGEALNQYVK